MSASRLSITTEPTSSIRAGNTMDYLKKIFAVTALWVVLVLSAQAAKVTYVYTDPQGTPLAEADADGNVTGTFDYKPYGEQVQGSPLNGPGYTGHVSDSDIGMIYMHARFYDPYTGRFLSADPKSILMGNNYSFNKYLYANGNPLMYFDPDGRAPSPLFQLDWFHQIIGRGFNENVSAPLQQAYEPVDRAVDKSITAIDNVAVITLSAEAAKGVGGGLELNILHPRQSALNIYPVANGFNISADIAPKEGLKFNLVKNPVQTAGKFSFGFEVGDGFHTGIALNFNPGGTLEVVPKFGFGVGELYKYSPNLSFDIFKDANKASEQQ